MNLKLKKSIPSPLGATKVEGGWNFAVFSEKPITLCIGASPTDFQEYEMEKTGSIYHIGVETDAVDLYYGYKQHNKLLVDPYAKLLKTGTLFGANAWSRASDELLAITVAPKHFDWEETEPLHLPKEKLIIYEMHVRAFTQDPSSRVTHRGSYMGLIEKIPYLQSLGITAIELMPIQEFDETEYHRKNPKTGAPLYNFWGYSPLSFFAPMQRYTGTNDAILELKELVKACHKANIEVILDVVFNHTGEGNEKGRTLSWKGFSDVYYMRDEQGHYMNYSGCGNTLNCNHPIVQDMILAALQYWHTEFHIDGFRFDLASILTRDQKGSPILPSPIIERITQDPILKNCSLFAESWDAAGLHQVGNFYKSDALRWSEWNDDYRSVIRKFVRGDTNLSGRFATKISGSQDMYGEGSPLNSLNYITSHDGFTLQDLVSYSHKHNSQNGEHNHDGMNNNDSSNYGHEGPFKAHSTPNKIEKLRLEQMKNFLLALFLSQGCPMLLMADEYGHTKQGNNNTWCQDNSLNWFLWDEIAENKPLVTFVKKLIKFRKEHPQLHRTSFLHMNEVEWHGKLPRAPDWSENSHLVAYTLKDLKRKQDLYIAFNSGSDPITITLPEVSPGKSWQLLIDTSDSTGITSGTVTMPAHSAIVAIEK